MKRMESVYAISGLVIGALGIAIAIYATIDQRDHEDKLVQDRQSSQHAAQLVEQLNRVRGKFELLQLLCHKQGVNQHEIMQAAIQLRDSSDELIARASGVTVLGKKYHDEFKCYADYNVSILINKNVCNISSIIPAVCHKIYRETESGCYKKYVNLHSVNINERMDVWGKCLTNQTQRLIKKKYGIDISTNAYTKDTYRV